MLNLSERLLISLKKIAAKCQYGNIYKSFINSNNHRLSIKHLTENIETPSKYSEDTRSVLNYLRVSYPSNIIVGHLVINSLRNKLKFSHL